VFILGRIWFQPFARRPNVLYSEFLCCTMHYLYLSLPVYAFRPWKSYYCIHFSVLTDLLPSFSKAEKQKNCKCTRISYKIYIYTWPILKYERLTSNIAWCYNFMRKPLYEMNYTHYLCIFNLCTSHYHHDGARAKESTWHVLFWRLTAHPGTHLNCLTNWTWIEAVFAVYCTHATLYLDQGRVSTIICFVRWQ
jgi:hypothetical protein